MIVITPDGETLDTMSDVTIVPRQGDYISTVRIFGEVIKVTYNYEEQFVYVVVKRE